MFLRFLRFWILGLLFSLTFSTVLASEEDAAEMGETSHSHHHSMDMSHDKSSYLLGPADASSMEVWDVGMGMLMPFPMAHMPMTMLMLHGNGFFEAIAEEGVARGRADFAAPNMFMADLGTSIGDSQYLNLDLMLTSDLWTIAKT